MTDRPGTSESLSFGEQVRRRLDFNKSGRASAPQTLKELATLVQLPSEDGRKATLSERTLTRWLSQETSPDPRAVAMIAELLKLPKAQLFESLGWLSQAETVYGDGSALVHNALGLLRLVADGRRSGSSWIADRARSRGYDATIHTEFIDVGGESVPYRDYVGLSRPEISVEQRRGSMTSGHQAEILKPLADVLRIAPGLVEDSPAKCANLQQIAKAELWIWVPRMMEHRAPLEIRGERHPLEVGRGSNSKAIETIIVVGDHGSGADDIAAMISLHLGWGHVNTSFLAQQIFGRKSTEQAQHAERCRELAQTFLRDEDLGEFMVIGHGNPNTTIEVIQAAALSRRRNHIAIIYPRASAALVNFAAEEWKERPDPTRDPLTGEAAFFQDANAAAMILAQSAGCVTQTLDIEVSDRLQVGGDATPLLLEAYWKAFPRLEEWLTKDFRKAAKLRYGFFPA